MSLKVLTIIVRLLLSLASLFFTGYIPVYLMLLHKNNDKIKYTGASGKLFIFFLSFYFGLFISSIYLIILSLSGIRFNLNSSVIFTSVFFAAFLLIAILQAKNNKRYSPVRQDGFLPVFGKKVTGNVIFGIMIFLIVLNISAVLFFTYLFPIRFWDSISCWSLKAKAFFTDGSIIPFYIRHNYDFSHLSYPLFIPLAQTWEYIWMGAPDETLVKTIFPVFYISLIFIFYYLFRQRIGKVISIVLVFFISALPVVMDHGYIEYTNLVFAIILLIGCYFLKSSIDIMMQTENTPAGRSFYLHKNNLQQDNINNVPASVRYLAMASVFFAMLAFVRTEGMLFLVLFIIIAAAISVFRLVKEKNKRTAASVFLSLIPAILLLMPWFILNRRAGIPGLSAEWAPVVHAFRTDCRAALSSFDFHNAFSSMAGQLLFSKYDSARAFFGSSYGIIWFAMLVVGCFNIKRLFTGYNWIYPVFIFCGFLSVFVSLGFIKEFAWSADRYLLHLLPLTYYWIFYNLPLFFGKDNSLDKAA
ncbi:MAG: hypothetical protein BWY60_00073 [Actinobacteria bacterium ADurb.Bin346]|nr:MAG: hypothetical protein BWY60_00073 [Actinobacteria bacterium ADurb.Bin346]